jgi:uncharacterized membrane-anchored protein YhcB (DUF1043 family)
MLKNIKSYWTWTKQNIVVVLGAVIGALLYYINLKNKKNNALKAQIDLVDTQKKADLLEIEIKQKLQDKNLLKKETQDLNQALQSLEEKRKNLGKQNKSKEEIEDFYK